MSAALIWWQLSRPAELNLGSQPAIYKHEKGVFPRIIRCKKSAARHIPLQELSALSFRTRVTCAHAHYTLLKKQKHLGQIYIYTHARTYIHNNGIMLVAAAASLPYKLITNSFVNEWRAQLNCKFSFSLSSPFAEQGDKSAAVCSMLLLLIIYACGRFARQLIKAHTQLTIIRRGHLEFDIRQRKRTRRKWEANNEREVT